MKATTTFKLTLLAAAVSASTTVSATNYSGSSDYYGGSSYSGSSYYSGGTRYITGPQGPRGYTGKTGATGSRGYTGDAGAKGPVGPKGMKGDKGDTGVTGPTGMKGDKGDKGDTGAAGPTGMKGDKGDKGDTGATGSTGMKGDKGDKGDTGATGSTGMKGDKGDKGDTGTAGPTGMKGDTGDRGEKGDTGATGPVGPAGTGAANITRFNVSTTCGYSNVDQFVNGSAVEGAACLAQCPTGASLIAGGCNVDENGFAIAHNGPSTGDMSTKSWSCDVINLNPADAFKTSVNVTTTAICLSNNGQELPTESENNSSDNGGDTGGDADAYLEAVTDTAKTEQYTPVIIDVLANDTGSDIRIDSFDEWAAVNGQVSKSDGKLIYKPYGDFIGNANFWYSIIDSNGNSYAAQVNVTVK